MIDSCRCRAVSLGKEPSATEGVRPDMRDPEQASGWSERTAADVSSLMVELGRVAKAIPFYGADADTAQTLGERACRALHTDLARAGPLELEVGDDGFHLAGIPGSFGSDHLASAARSLRRAGVQRIRFTEVISTASLMSFMGSLDGLEDGERPASQLGIEVDDEICLRLGSDEDSESLTTQEPFASLGSSLLKGSGEETRASDDKPSIDQDPGFSPRDSMASVR